EVAESRLAGPPGHGQAARHARRRLRLDALCRWLRPRHFAGTGRKRNVSSQELSRGSDDAEAGLVDRRASRHRRLHRRLGRRRSASRLHDQCPARRSRQPGGARLHRRTSRPRATPGSVHRRSTDPDRRRSSADPALLPLPRAVRRGRAGPGFARSMRRPRE
ncbi:MAG: CCA tRNA nucleotidyltransferase, partial [uncultured Sphingomonadaceae bacterium]